MSQTAVNLNNFQESDVHPAWSMKSAKAVGDYARAADYLNFGVADVVSLQRWTESPWLEKEKRL